jgi:predicted  nucleic acid-binding Zn-ribbon protein
MDVGPYVAFSTEVQQIGGVPTTVITCLTDELTQDQLAPGMDLIVYGDELTISAALSLPGQKMTIIARTVTMGAGASVDLSGAVGAPVSPAQARNGLPGASAQQPDATDGGAGQTGNHGQAAGSFTLAAGTMTGTLSVRSEGGAGGTGQRGGDGGTGLNGANGENYQINEISGPPNSVYGLVSQGQPGTNGGRAGVGGVGGQGGDGGGGGAITIASFSRDPNVRAQNGGGASGAGGAGGTSGTPGIGGGGGEIGVHTVVSGKGLSDDSWTPYDAAGNGPFFAANGLPGVVAPATGSPGQPGSPGPAAPAASIDPAPDFYVRYAPGIPYLMLTLRQAEFNYLSGEAAGGTYQGAVDLLVWLLKICTPPAGVTADPARAQVLARATALLGQIGQKLNFYGEPPNHVPLANLAYYQSQLPGEIADGVTIESTYNDYVAAAGNQQTQLAKLGTMLGALNNRITALNALVGPLQSQITASQAEVSALQLARNQQAVLFAAAEQQWEARIIGQLKEMASNAACATYTDIFDVAKGVLTVEDPDDLGNITTKFNFSGVDIATIQGLMGDVANWDDAITAIDAAQSDMPSVIGAISALGSATVSADSGKIAVERASFELTLEPFEKLDGTDELKDQLNLYLAKVQAANQSQVDYNALQIQLLNLNATIAQATTEQTQIQDQISHAQDPTITAFKVFMARTYGESLDRIIKDVYGLSQAYRYWALADYTLPPSNGDWTMAYLADVQSDLTAKVLDAINDYGSGQASPTQPFDFRTATAPVWRIDAPAMLAAFRKNGSLDFSITLEDRWVAASFAGMAQVIATEFTVEVHGAGTTAGNLFVRLTHSGMAPFVDTAGKRWQFSHIPVLTSYDYTIASGQTLAGGSLAGQEGVEIGLSPFTTWRLSVLPADNPGLDLTKVENIEVRFAGRYRTASGASRAR